MGDVWLCSRMSRSRPREQGNCIGSVTFTRQRPSHRCDTTVAPTQHKVISLYYSYRSNNIPPPIDPSAAVAREIGVDASFIVNQNKLNDRFLKGSILLEPLATASCLPGKALAVYIALRHRCDLECKTTVSLPAALLRSFGVSRDAKARALRALEEVGLIQVKRSTGLAARITLNV